VSEGLVYLLSGFWLGALHAATPGHGKTIAAAYIVGARGRPVDAVVLGVFVTLSHTAGIVGVAVLASLGAARWVPARIEAYLAVATALLVVAIGGWMVRVQWTALFRRAPRHGHDGEPDQADHDHGGHVHADHDAEHHHTAHDHAGRPAAERRHAAAHDHGVTHRHAGEDATEYAHSHGWGPAHTHRFDAFTDTRPSWAILLGLGLAGGLLPDPGALGLLLTAIARGKPVTGLVAVLVFSLGFALVLVVVGVVAARVGELVLTWLSGRWVLWLQLGTALVILAVGLGLSVTAWRAVAALG
jgi:nickel/cobalt transporter (NicO) family protein